VANGVETSVTPRLRIAGELSRMTNRTAETMPSLPEFDPGQVVDLDVREDLRRGREPLVRIVAAAHGLPPGGVLHLRTTFQPTPLFLVLRGQGYSYHSEGFAADDWSSWFWRTDMPPVAASASAPAIGNEAVEGVWDLRTLPAPQPLTALLERLAGARTPFDALLPMYSDLLGRMIANAGWDSAVVGELQPGVRVHLAPVSPHRD
jgi:hypothetical protein